MDAFHSKKNRVTSSTIGQMVGFSSLFCSIAPRPSVDTRGACCYRDAIKVELVIERIAMVDVNGQEECVMGSLICRLRGSIEFTLASPGCRAGVALVMVEASGFFFSRIFDVVNGGDICWKFIIFLLCTHMWKDAMIFRVQRVFPNVVHVFM